MAQFKLKSILPGFKRLFGMTAEVYTESGDLLGSVDLNNDRKRFSFTFDKEDAFEGSKKADLEIKLIDNNGDDFNFSAKGGKEFDLNTDEQTFTTTISANKRRARSKLSPEVTLIEPEQPVAPVAPVVPVVPVVPATGGTITLSAQQDIYSNSLGSRLIGGTLLQNDDRFTAFDDVVNASAGSLSFLDDLVDSSSSDTDTLNLSTTANNNLDNAFTNPQQVVNIEKLEINAINDNSAFADLTNFQGLKSVSASGNFTNQVDFRNYLSSGAREFDFSAVNTGGVNFTNANSGINTNNAITLIGSNAADILEANNGAAQLSGRGGIDNIQGSAVVGSTITGGSGRDVITLQAANSVDTVSMVTITANTNGDDITGFVGANTNANAADLLRFDASTFNTYAAGNTVTQVDAATANASQSSNLFIVDSAAAIAAVNTQTGEGTLALDDAGLVLFSGNGDFTTNSVEIGTIDDFANFVASANVDIV